MWRRQPHEFRPGRSRLTLLAALERAVVGEDRWVLVADDVTAAFDRVPIDTVLAHHRPVLANNPLFARLVESVLRGEVPARAVGLDPGCPYAPTALNALLHHAADAHAPGPVRGLRRPCSGIPTALQTSL